MSTSDPNPGAKRKAVRRNLHWFTWVVFALTSLAVTLIVVPGVYVPPTLLEKQPFMWGGTGGTAPPDPTVAEGPLSVAEYEHGWPWTYARRAKGFGGKDWPKPSFGDDPFCKPLLAPWSIIVWWSVSDAWPIGSDASRWNLWALFADLAVAGVIILFATAACEVWLRRRGGFGRFRLIDLLGSFLVFATVLGWWRWNMLETNANHASIATLKAAPACIDQEAVLERQGTMVYPGVYWAYDGPEWLCRLAGSPEFFRSYLFRVKKLTIDIEHTTPHDGESIKQLRDLEELWVRKKQATLPEDFLEEFAEFKHVRTEPAGKFHPAYTVLSIKPPGS